MKFVDWIKKLGKSDKSATPVPDAKSLARGDVRDARLLPKPAPKNYWERPDPVMSSAEAHRAFSPGMRTRDHDARTLGLDEKRLIERGLPVWADEAALAADLDLTTGKLFWLASHRYDDRVSHYTQFRVPKRRGGYRTIMAPKTGLKSVQWGLLSQLCNHLPQSDFAHGFVTGRSVATNAAPHVGKRVVLRFDLEDFFGTVTFGRVRGYLVAMGYSHIIASSLALLMTEADRQPVEIDDELHYVPIGHRYCVQGAPTSPAICNAIAMKLDHRLAGFAAKHGYAYTRYADDLTFSGDDESKIGLLLRVVAEVVDEEGFRLNTSKTAVMRSGSTQRVTGVIVNETLGLSRKDRRKLRAKIHQMSAQSPNEEITKLRGELAYLAMLNPAQADALRPDWLR